MLKKILKHTLRTLLVILLVLLLVPALLYVPAVQDLARRRAVAYASRTLGMEVSVERIRLAFRCGCRWTIRCWPTGRTRSFAADTLSLDVALWPLLRKEVAVRSSRAGNASPRTTGHLGGHGPAVAAGEFVRRMPSARTFGQHGRHLPHRSRRRGRSRLNTGGERSRREKGERRGPAVDVGRRRELRSQASPSGCGPPLR